MVVSNELKEPIRSHHDIDRDSAKHYKRAIKVSPYMLSKASAHADPDSFTKRLPSELPIMVM
jgi:hypothetical protein